MEYKESQSAIRVRSSCAWYIILLNTSHRLTRHGIFRAPGRNADAVDKGNVLRLVKYRTILTTSWD